jgi:hypothetical protein
MGVCSEEASAKLAPIADSRSLNNWGSVLVIQLAGLTLQRVEALEYVTGLVAGLCHVDRAVGVPR